MSFGLSISSLNFGAINDNKFEFVDRSDPERKAYFEKVYEAFKSTQDNQIILYDYLTDSGTYDTVTYDALFHEANSFCRKYLSPETLRAMMGNDSEFDLKTCTMSNMFTQVLTRDKGIGGFEQPNSKRVSNVIRHYHKLSDTDALREFTTFLDEYISPLRNEDTYQEYFLKGRKEGHKVEGKKTQKNYYNEALLKERNAEDDQCFNSLGKLILITFDRLQHHLLRIVPLPKCFVQDDVNDILTQKCRALMNYIAKNDYDIIFLQEFQRDIIHFPDDHEYIIYYGEESNDLCNAIIYKRQLGTAYVFSIYDEPSVANRIEDDGEIIVKNYDQYKELPLVLGIGKDKKYYHGLLYTDMVLISYHSGGKGILNKNKTFAESDLYQFMNHWSIPVIVGADLNCNVLDSLGNVDEGFSVFPHNMDYTYTTFKERSPLQAQFDKVGKLDKKVKDCIMTMNLTLETEHSYVRMLNGQEITNQDDMSLCLPMDEHPFDHYVLETQVVIEETLSEQLMNYVKNMIGWIA